MPTSTAVSLCFIFGMSTLAFSYSSLKLNALDLSPNYAGSIMAVVNGAGCISGVLAPYFVGILTTHVSIKMIRSLYLIRIRKCRYFCAHFLSNREALKNGGWFFGSWLPCWFLLILCSYYLAQPNWKVGMIVRRMTKNTYKSKKMPN